MGLGASVTALPRPCEGHLGPRQRGDAAVQGGLVALDGEQVVRPTGAQVGGVLALGVQRVRGDQVSVQVRQGVQGGGERGDLIPALNPNLGKDQLVSVVVDRDQFRGLPVAAVGSPQGLAVHRQHGAPLSNRTGRGRRGESVTVGAHPRAQRRLQRGRVQGLQQPADRQSMRKHTT